MNAFKKTELTFHKDELPLSPAPQDLEGREGGDSNSRAITALEGMAFVLGALFALACVRWGPVLFAIVGR